MKPKLVCIDIGFEQIKVINRLLPKDMTVSNCTFDDQKALFTECVPTTVLFCNFTRDQDNCKNFFKAIRTNWSLRHIGFISLEAAPKGPALLLGEELGIQDWIPLPSAEADLKNLFEEFQMRIDNLAVQADLETKFEENLKAGDLIAGKKCIDSLMMIDERNQNYNVMLGYFHEKNDEPKLAEAIYKKCLVHAPKYVKALNALALLYSRGGDHKRANKYFSVVTKISGDSHVDILTAGAVEASGNEKRPFMQKAFENTAGEDFALESLEAQSDTLEATGQRDEVIKLFEKVQATSESEKIKARLGSKIAELVRESDPEAAKKIYKDILDYGDWLPDDIITRLQRLGMKTGALGISYDFNKKKRWGA